MERILAQELIDKVKAELSTLDQETIEVDGLHLKPSQCYHLGMSPAHVLFNTNCPDGLKTRVQAILAKYSSDDEMATGDAEGK